MRVSVWRLATAVALLTVLGLSGPLQRADGPDRPLTPTAASVGGLTIEDGQARALLAGIEASDAQGLVEEDVVLAAATPTTSPPVVTPAGGAAVPEVALAAYERAAEASPTLWSGCTVRWQILAGIGKVESNHDRGGGAQGVTEEGTVWPSIRGLRLDGGPGLARVGDTDGGRLDGDVVFDRAVGPMQFLPTSWGAHGHDGNKDTVKDPNNLFDAAFGAADHLCARAPGDYTTRADLSRALYRYNPSMFYVAAVTAWIDVYDRGGAPAPAAQPVSEAAVAAADAPSSFAASDTDPSSAPPSAPSTASPPEQASPPAPSAAHPQPSAAAQPEAPAPHPQTPPSAPAPSATPATPAPEPTPASPPSPLEPSQKPGDADPANSPTARSPSPSPRPSRTPRGSRRHSTPPRRRRTGSPPHGWSGPGGR